MKKRLNNFFSRFLIFPWKKIWRVFFKWAKIFLPALFIFFVKVLCGALYIVWGMIKEWLLILFITFLVLIVFICLRLMFYWIGLLLRWFIKKVIRWMRRMKKRLNNFFSHFFY